MNAGDTKAPVKLSAGGLKTVDDCRLTEAEEWLLCGRVKGDVTGKYADVLGID